MKRTIQTIIAFTLLLGAQTSFSQDIDLQSLVGEYKVVQYSYYVPLKPMDELDVESEKIDTLNASISIVNGSLFIDVENGELPLKITDVSKKEDNIIFNKIEWSDDYNDEISIHDGSKYKLETCNFHSAKYFSICFQFKSTGILEKMDYYKLILLKK